MEQVTMNLPADMRREEMNVAELSPLACPEEFVGLETPQHVELAGALLDGGANGERHQHQADAVLLILVVEAVLIKGERPVVEEAVHHGDRCAVQAEDVHPKPAAFERTLRHFVVEGTERPGSERGAALVKAALVIPHECRKRITTLSLSRHGLEAHVELLFKCAGTTADVCTVRCAKGSQV